ncbi:MAG: glucosaminidase domain-containing protein, partial [Prevotella sp.]|nr:glucosaminidase domain-containing protein [Prevotella sp.]
MNRKVLVAILTVTFLTSVVHAQNYRWNASFQTYIDQYRDLAIQEMLRYNIPASITLAQGLLESGAGKSELVRKGNNHFGIKCHGWTGRTVYHDDDLTQECFRAYDNALQSFEDHSKFLVNGTRYRSLFS